MRREFKAFSYMIAVNPPHTYRYTCVVLKREKKMGKLYFFPVRTNYRKVGII